MIFLSGSKILLNFSYQFLNHKTPFISIKTYFITFWFSIIKMSKSWFAKWKKEQTSLHVPFLDNATHNEWHGMHQINKKYFDFKMSKTCKKSTHQNFLFLLKPMHLYTSVLNNIKLSIQNGQNSPEK